jgi:hypothetical protein
MRQREDGRVGALKAHTLDGTLLLRNAPRLKRTTLPSAPLRLGLDAHPLRPRASSQACLLRCLGPLKPAYCAALDLEDLRQGIHRPGGWRVCVSCVCHVCVMCV